MGKVKRLTLILPLMIVVGLLAGLVSSVLSDGEIRNEVVVVYKKGTTEAQMGDAVRMVEGKLVERSWTSKDRAVDLIRV